MGATMKKENAGEYALRTEQLTKVYGKKKVVDSVSMHVKKGDIYGFIGKNGAGKTTFMRMVAGLAQPTFGEIELFGATDIDRQRMRIGTLIEQPGAYPRMTAYENLELLRRAYGITDRTILPEVLKLVSLENTGKKKVKDFSMGMKQRLGIAMALLKTPDFLILDEPINGLDPEGIHMIRELLIRLNQEKNITIIISSHILGELSKMASAYGIIRDGALVEELSASELLQRCRRCHKIVINNANSGTALATNILEQRLGINDFDVPEKSMIRIFGHLDDIAQINKALTNAGVEIIESYTAGQDLEEYFMERTNKKDA